jgi:hypothetical protein
MEEEFRYPALFLHGDLDPGVLSSRETNVSGSGADHTFDSPLSMLGLLFARTISLGCTVC